jgi:hypothetical protein
MRYEERNQACFSNIHSCRLKAFVLSGLRAYATYPSSMFEGRKVSKKSFCSCYIL